LRDKYGTVSQSRALRRGPASGGARQGRSSSTRDAGPRLRFPQTGERSRVSGGQLHSQLPERFQAWRQVRNTSPSRNSLWGPSPSGRPVPAQGLTVRQQGGHPRARR
jgi:hypothetical protein